MSRSLFDKGREKFATAGIGWVADTIKLVLVNHALWGKTITAATNATPIVITATAHGFANGDAVAIKNVLGNTAANGRFRIANVTANTFELVDFATGANIAGSGAYTSGGSVVNLTSNEFLSAIPGGAILGTSAALSNKSATLGVLSADDYVFSSVTTSVNAIDTVVIYKDTGVAGTSPLIYYADDYTNMPLVPNGGGVTIDFNQSSADKIVRI